MNLNFRKLIANKIYPEGEKERRQLERLSLYDQLTGLANRRAFDLALNTAEKDPEVGVILFDANNFGKINKILGHLAGDRLLKKIAQSIQSSAGKFGFKERVFRIGGDEFVVLAPKPVCSDIIVLAQNKFGLHPNNISITGVWANTFAQADSMIQTQKTKIKNQQNKTRNENKI